MESVKINTEILLPEYYLDVSKNISNLTNPTNIHILHLFQLLLLSCSVYLD